MRKGILFFSISIFLFAIVYVGCRRDEPIFDEQSCKYPIAIANIIMTKCAVSGCHNTQSKDACAGLDLSTWDKMMDGDRNGAVCIPYSAENSTMFLFTNTFHDMGATVTPTMPNNGVPLTREQETTLRNWIDGGAPDASGFVKWSDNPHRKKYYVTQQGCDLVCVVDAETNLQMRYIPVGADAAVEGPHNVKISPNGLYWACSFIAGRYLEVHRTTDDALVTRILLGPTDSAAVGSWNTFTFTPNSQYAFAVDWNSAGRVSWLDMQTFRWRQTYQGGLYIDPHGSCVSPDGHNLYLAPTTGNYIYKDDITIPQLPSDSHVIIDGNSFENPGGNYDCPHDVIFSPDGTKYFVTSQHTNMVRIMDAASDQLVASIPVGTYPQEMAVSSDPSTPYLYVTCMEDTTTFSHNRGSVAVINWQTNSFVTAINTGWQPHGITVNDDLHVVLVANRNATPDGPAPHHTTSCGGRNGYFSLINMNTNTVIEGSKTEMTVDPYSAAYRR